METTKVQKKKGMVTSKDVAARANVSQATVSRVFSNSSSVKEDTIKRVMKAARELGYTPNAIARSLNSKKTNMVAVVTVNFENPFYQTLLIKISDLVKSLGKQMLFIQSPFEQDLDDILDRVLQYQVDGVIVLSAAISSEMKDRFTQVNIPLVIFNKQFDSHSFYSVCSDNVDSGTMVAEYLINKGYTSFGYISGDRLKQTSGNRYKGYVTGLESHGFSCSICVNGDYTYESGYNALKEMYKRGPLPRAIFCANDLMAFGAIDAARNLFKLRIPEDVAFVGFDNLEQCEWKSYNLTSVAQPVEEMVEYTRNYLQKRFKGIATSGGYVLLKCTIIERGTT